jgi:hypothetical protein
MKASEVALAEAVTIQKSIVTKSVDGSGAATLKVDLDRYEDELNRRFGKWRGVDDDTMGRPISVEGVRVEEREGDEKNYCMDAGTDKEEDKENLTLRRRKNMHIEREKGTNNVRVSVANDGFSDSSEPFSRSDMNKVD